MTDKIKSHQIQRLISAFRKACRPPTPFEEAEDYCKMALAALADTSRPEGDRYAAAIRLLTCIKPIGNGMTDDALNTILARDFTLPEA